MIILKKYLTFFYFLIIKNKFYYYFFNLIYKKILNVLSFYNIKKIEKFEKLKSKLICKSKCINSKNYLKNNLKKINYQQKKKYFYLVKEIIKLKNRYKKNFKTKGPANLNLLIFQCIKTRPKNILETGVSQGWSSSVFLKYLANENLGGKLFSIDLPYIEQNDSHKLVGKIVEKKYYRIWKLFKMPDSYGLDKIKKKNIKFDLIHYDSDKSIYGRSRSYPILWDLLNKKGILISDDIGDNMTFFNFCLRIKKEPLIIKNNNKFQGLITK